MWVIFPRIYRMFRKILTSFRTSRLTLRPGSESWDGNHAQLESFLKNIRTEFSSELTPLRMEMNFRSRCLTTSCTRFTTDFLRPTTNTSTTHRPRCLLRDAGEFMGLTCRTQFSARSITRMPLVNYES